ncbi:MAG: hypothetical protein AB7G08_33040 [Hyphomicrobiaceae bacterium]
MSGMTLSGTLIAWWGAALSTVLAFVKLWEIWRDRFRIEVSYNFTGSEQIGNEVLIRNLGNRPFILAHWELFYASRYCHRWKESPIESREYDDGDTTVDPQRTLTLRFSEERYFWWGGAAMRRRAIYIRLHIAGRRPITRTVYQS